MWRLQFRLFVLWALMFSLVYAFLAMAARAIGINNFFFYILLAFGMLFFQYLIGPKIVEWSMQVRYVSEDEAPELHAMIADLAKKAGIPKPKVGVSPMDLPNAFAFGRGVRDGRMCVTQGIVQLLDKEELRAVLGHEMSHLKNRDVLTITMISAIPLLFWYLARYLMWGGGNSRDNSRSQLALFGFLSLILYFLSNLFVLFASRLREYFADKGSIELGCPPQHLASALYKLVYGTARLPKEQIEVAEGCKAFFVSDPSRAYEEIKELKSVDIDLSGTIDAKELAALRNKEPKLGAGDKLMELLSTHPNMLKRIKQLSEYTREQ